ncbi:hypothetical protein ACRARG_14160 [Pseudooceanicola sp. C21-150M6]|uniref:hypothetical protein n=1 Tax=Pseudooceanicola sp. C21-150M6 TaxID=3434355 RepID=UPI003D7F43BB
MTDLSATSGKTASARGISRIVIDPETAILIASTQLVPDPRYQLLAPTLLRSHVLDRLYTRVRDGAMSEEDGLKVNAGFAKLKIRFLGDAVMRRRAWAIAARGSLPSTSIAEYVSLTQLQADALATRDEAFIIVSNGLVPTIDPHSLAVTA